MYNLLTNFKKKYIVCFFLFFRTISKNLKSNQKSYRKNNERRFLVAFFFLFLPLFFYNESKIKVISRKQVFTLWLLKNSREKMNCKYNFF